MTKAAIASSIARADQRAARRLRGYSRRAAMMSVNARFSGSA